MVKNLPPILEVGGVLISSDLLTEEFCCDLDVCHGACCVEGDAGAPVTLDEIGEIESCVDEVWKDLSAQAQSVIDRQGVAYTDQEGDLVTVFASALWKRPTARGAPIGASPSAVPSTLSVPSSLPTAPSA